MKESKSYTDDNRLGSWTHDDVVHGSVLKT